MPQEVFVPPPLSSHEGPVEGGFTPPPLSAHEGPAGPTGPTSMGSRMAEATGIPSLYRGLTKDMDTAQDKGTQAAKNVWETVKQLTVGGSIAHLSAAHDAAAKGDYTGAIQEALRGATSLTPGGVAHDLGDSITQDVKDGNYAGAITKVGMIAAPTAGVRAVGAVGKAAATLRNLPAGLAREVAGDVVGMASPRAGHALNIANKVAKHVEKLKSTAPAVSPTAPEPPSTIIQPSVVGAGRPSEALAQFQSPVPAARQPFDPGRIGYPNANPNAGGSSAPQPLAPKGPTSTQWMPDRIGSDPVQQMYPNANPQAGGTGTPQPPTPKGPTSTQWMPDRIGSDPVQQMYPNANPQAGGTGTPPPPAPLVPNGPRPGRTTFEMGTTNRTPVQDLYPNANPAAGGNPGGGPAGSGFETPVPSREKMVFEEPTRTPVQRMFPNANFDSGGSSVTPATPLPTPAEAGFGPNPPPAATPKTNVFEESNRAKKTTSVSQTLYNKGAGIPRDKLELLKSTDPALKGAQDKVWEEIEKITGKTHSPKSRGQVIKKTLDLHDEADLNTPATPVPER